MNPARGLVRSALCLIMGGGTWAQISRSSTSIRDLSPLIIAISRSTLMRRKSALRTGEKSPASIPVRLCAKLRYSIGPDFLGQLI